jgi:acetyltransferase-like isoleucine patch superfamily enzyme
MRNIYYFLKFVFSIPTRIFSKIDFSVIVKKSFLHKKCAIEGPSKIYDSRVGRYTYIGKNSTICNTQIGSFCSIADYCISSPGKHPIDAVSSSPVFYSKKNIFRTSFINREFTEYENTIIGSDVWIGSHVFIKGGLKIGHGAIIGAYSVVTKDVEPYTIIGGNPARIIRKRFDDDIIESLIKSEWWNYDEFTIKSLSVAFEKPTEFIELLKVEE